MRDLGRDRLQLMRPAAIKVERVKSMVTKPPRKNDDSEGQQWPYGCVCVFNTNERWQSKSEQDRMQECECAENKEWK